MVCSLPSVVSSRVLSASWVGFSGSRSVVPPFAVWSAVVGVVPQSSAVSVGCAQGVDSFVRSSFPSAVVFRAASFGRGRGAFAARSVAFVRALSLVPLSVLVSFPAAACPTGLLPSSQSSTCFCGLGSGSWASLAFAVGSGVHCFVWLPAGVVVPASWGFVSLGGGWWSSR